MTSEFLLRVKPLASGGFTASIRQFAGTAHPDVRAVLGPVAYGSGANEAAAMVAAIAAAHIPSVVHEVASHGC